MNAIQLDILRVLIKCEQMGYHNEKFVLGYMVNKSLLLGYQYDL